ncbi:MAG: methyltransferase domain-containing protein [Kiritimatiellia bacterium]
MAVDMKGMSESDEVLSLASCDGYLFRRSLVLQTELQEVLAAAGDLSAARCLEIGADNAMFSYQLQLKGGTWKTLALDAAAALRISEALEREVGIMGDDAAWPKEDGTFDLIVLPGVLETRDVDVAFIERCHSLLKSGGRMIVTLMCEKRFTMLKPLLRSRICGNGAARRLYTERRLYALLKCGFDVIQVRTHARFFSALCDWYIQSLLQKSSPDVVAHRMQVAHRSRWLYWIAYQLDCLLLFTRGHRMVALAVRHNWKSREAPVLMDGRSIGEAVLMPISQ